MAWWPRGIADGLMILYVWSLWILCVLLVQLVVCEFVSGGMQNKDKDKAKMASSKADMLTQSEAISRKLGRRIMAVQLFHSARTE